MAIQAEVLEAQVRVTGVSAANRDLDRFGRNAEQQGRRVQGAGKSMRNAFAGLGIAAAATGAGKFLKSTADDASDLNETVSMSATIFGKHQKAMDRWASGAWKSVGLGKNAALSAAAGFGDMFSQIGFTQRQAAKMSRTVVQMSADLGSFKNLKTAEVTDMMSAAFRGEYDSLQRVIPNINAARVETEALAATGKKSAKELTAQEKAAATLSIVMRDGKRAVGDFNKTSDGAANQQKILQAQIENTKVKVGQSLLPAYRNFWQFANNKLVPGVNDLIDGMKNGTGTGGELARMFTGTIVPAVKDLAQVGKDLLPFLEGAGKLAHMAVQAFGSLPAPLRSNVLLLGGLALGFSKLGGGLGPMIGNLRTAEGRTAGMARGLNAMGGALRNVAGAGGMMLLADSTNRTSKGMSALQGAAGGALSGAALGAFAGPVGAGIGAAVGGLAGGIFGLTQNTKNSGDEAKNAVTDWTQYAGTLNQVTGAVTAATRAAVYQNLQQKGLLATANASGISSRRAVQAALGNKAAQSELTLALARNTELTTDQYQAWKKELPVLAESQQRIREQATAVENYGNKLKGLPRRLQTEIKTNGVEKSVEGAAALISQFKLTPKQVKSVMSMAGLKPTADNMKKVNDQVAIFKKSNPKPTVGLNGYVKTLAELKNLVYWANQFRPPTPGSTGQAPSDPTLAGLVGVNAKGGTIAGPRQPYGDKVLSWLAPGEEVISNDRGQADRARGLLKMINANKFAKGGTAGGSSGKALGAALSGAGLADAVKNGMGSVVGVLARMERIIKARSSGAREKRLLAVLRKRDDALLKAQKRRDDIAAKLNAAVARRDALVQARDEFKTNVVDGIKSQANVLNAGNNVADIRANLETQAGKAQEFARTIQELRRKGYSSAVIQQVASAGIEGGLEVAKALVAGSASDVSAINASFKSITDTADAQGKLLADQFYKAGINSANGVVKGLQSQKAEIEKTLVGIAKGMVKALRKALGIKSPSKAFRAEMPHVGRGIILGLADQHRSVSKGAASLAGAVLGGFNAGASRLTPAAMGAGVSGAGVALTFITHNPIAEPQSQTTNKALARVAAVGLV